MRAYPVSAVIVAFNSAKVIDACLRSLRGAAPAEILVIDNNSQDTTAAQVRQHRGVRLLPLAVNTGFAHACNVGVAQTHQPLVLFLNDDATLDADYLGILCQTLRDHPQAASACGKLLLPPGQKGSLRLDSSGIRLDRYALRLLDAGHGEVDRGQFDAAASIFGPSGAAALYRRAALEDGTAHHGDGPFDATMFAYYEDVDLAWRLRRRGWEHRYEPRARGVHARRGPGNKPLAVAARAFVNRYRVFWRHEGLLKFLSYAPIAVPWELARLVRLGLRRPQLLGAIGNELCGAFAKPS